MTRDYYDSIPEDVRAHLLAPCVTLSVVPRGETRLAVTS